MDKMSGVILALVRPRLGKSVQHQSRIRTSDVTFLPAAFPEMIEARSNATSSPTPKYSFWIEGWFALETTTAAPRLLALIRQSLSRLDYLHIFPAFDLLSV